ncbi:MAG: hypothetical protein PGMFKBFP_00081 [Anaerolineales bacterium]|nr:hypothetical protein [Anaerolineales bacterium]
MPRADGDPVPVEDLRYVVRMDAVQRERRDGSLLVRRGAEDLHAGNLLETFQRVLDDLMFVRGDFVHADRGQVVHGRAETDCLGNGGSPRLEFVRDRIRAEGAQLHFLDHVAAAEEGRHGFEQFGPAVQRADAGRAAHLVRGEGDEVRAEGLGVDREMRGGLGRVHEGRRADFAREADDLGRGVHRPEDIGHLGERDQLRVTREKRAVRVQVEQAVRRHGDEVQLDAAFRRQHVPRHEVGVVLHLGQDDQVSGFEIRPRPGIRHEVDGLGRVARVDDLPRRFRVDELRDLLARLLVQRGGLFRQRVDAAMDVRVRAAVEIVHRLDDRERFLRSGRGIEIGHARPAGGSAFEDREVCADEVGVQHGVNNREFPSAPISSRRGGCVRR